MYNYKDDEYVGEDECLSVGEVEGDFIFAQAEGAAVLGHIKKAAEMELKERPQHMMLISYGWGAGLLAKKTESGDVVCENLSKDEFSALKNKIRDMKHGYKSSPKDCVDVLKCKNGVVYASAKARAYVEHVDQFAKHYLSTAEGMTKMLVACDFRTRIVEKDEHGDIKDGFWQTRNVEVQNASPETAKDEPKRIL